MGRWFGCLASHVGDFSSPNLLRKTNCQLGTSSLVKTLMVGDRVRSIFCLASSTASSIGMSVLRLDCMRGRSERVR